MNIKQYSENSHKDFFTGKRLVKTERLRESNNFKLKSADQNQQHVASVICTLNIKKQIVKWVYERFLFTYRAVPICIHLDSVFI